MKKYFRLAVCCALLAAGLLMALAGEHDISSPGVAYFSNPMWACGDAPPFFVVDISVCRDQYRGKALRCFQHGRALNEDGQPGAEPGSFLVCEGRVKRSLFLFLRERFLMEGTAATGIFFDATACTAARPTAEQMLFIDRMLYDDESLDP